MAEMDRLKQKLKKLGYSKFKDDTRTRVFVYVPKADVNIELNDTEKELSPFGAYLDLSSASLSVSSKGVIRFKADQSEFQNLQIAFKPDASKDLTTDEHESLTAYMCALKFKNPDTDYSLDDLEDTRLNVQSRFTGPDLFNKASKGWFESSKLHAERIHRFLGRQQKKYHFLQRSNSKWVDSISDKATDLITKSGKKMKLDKWNPADIWVVSSTELNHDFSHYDSIHMLNSMLTEKFESRDIIGISLKKATKTVKATPFNYRFRQKMPTFDRLELGKKSYLKSIDGIIYYNKGSEIVFRSFQPGGAISGEIKGRFAQGGKVGSGEINDIIKECSGGDRMPLPNEIRADFKKNQTQYLKNLYNKAREVDTRLKNISQDTFVKEIMTRGPKTESYLVSKVMVTHLMEELNKAPKDKIECAIAKMISYAASSTDISSVFVKVYTG